MKLGMVLPPCHLALGSFARKERSIAGIVLAAVALVLPAVALSDVTVAEQQITRTTTFTYDPGSLRVQTLTLQPDGGDSLKQVTAFTYWPAGNKKTETLTGWAGGPAGTTQDRTTTTNWDSSDRFPSTVYNAKQQVESLTYDPTSGLLTQRIDANNQKTVWQYDPLGRKQFELRGYSSPTANDYTNYTQWTYQRCAELNGCNTVAGVAPVYVVTAVTKAIATGGNPEVQIAPPTKAYFDALNREIRVETQGLGASNAVKTIYRDTVYDARGYAVRVSQPYFSDATPLWTDVQFDDLGRKLGETAPNQQYTSYSYDGLTSTKTMLVNGVVRVIKSTQNALNQLVQVQDANSNITNYVYDVTGGLSQTVDPYGNVVQIGYDVRGRRTTLNDPDLGAWSYMPNAFGEVVSQTNALGKTSTMVYDVLGRIQQRTDTDLATNYTYDTANGVGKLASVYATNGYCREQTYDGYSRPFVTTLKIGAGSTACSSYSLQWAATTTYDAVGRVSTETLPTGFATRRVYDTSIGALAAVKNYTGSVDGIAYWRRASGDAQGHVTGYVYGNNVATLLGYDDQQMGWLKTISAGTGGNPANVNIQQSSYGYDTTGQLAERVDAFDLPNALTERSQVDVLGRLKSYARYSGGVEIANTRISVVYDAVGRIKSKSDVGTFYYAGAAAGQARPHAVTGIRGGATEADYHYDAIGNMTDGAGRTFFYTDAGLLRMAGNSSTCQEFLTEGEGLRVQQVIYGQACQTSNGQPNNGSSTQLARTIYMHPDAANGLSFERETKGGVDNYKHYVTVGGRPVALLVSQTGSVNSGTPMTVEYLHYDHLGSIVAVTSDAGTVTERRSFDPWGNPRQLNGAAGTGELPNGLSGEATDRGFTLHEHLEGLNLVHMNGRIYDPLLARFTSGDPKVTSPFDGQSYDRYAYVMNRPLDSTDPTGYAGESVVIFDPAAGGWTDGGGAALTQALYFGGGAGKPDSYIVSNWGISPGVSYLNLSEARSSAGRFFRRAAEDGDELAELLAPSNNWVLFPGAVLPSYAAKYFGSVVEPYANILEGNATSLDWFAAVATLAGPLVKYGGRAIGSLRGEIGAFLESRAAPALKACACCFVAGTPVWAADGPMPIEDIRVGTLVKSRDEVSGVDALKPVTALIHSPGREVFALVLVGDAGKVSRIEVSDNHPFHVKGRGWVDSAQLKRGMIIDTLADGYAAVANIMPLGRQADTYNLTVADFHTFFAGEAAAWVHNQCPCSVAAKLSAEAKDVLRSEARDAWQTATGRRAIWDGLQVHHRIPLEYAHLFPKADPNRLANLVGVNSSVHTQISNAWAAWGRSLGGRVPTQAEVMRQTLAIDKQFGAAFTFAR